MNKFISLFLSLIVAFPSYAAGPVIWGPGGAQNISSGPVYDSSIPYIKQPETNYIANQSGIIDTTGWAGSGTATVTRVTTSLPRATTVGTGLSLASGAVNDYVQYCWTIDTSDLNTKLSWTWSQAPSSYTAGDFVAQVYSFAGAGCTSTATQLNIDQVSSGQDYSIANYTGALGVSFDTTSATHYGVRYTRKAGSSTLVISNVIVGPGNILPMPAVGNWYTPTVNSSLYYGATLATNTSSIVTRVKRESDSADIQMGITFSGAANANGEMTFRLPDSLTINSTAIADTFAVFGKAWGFFNNKLYQGVVRLHSSGNEVRVIYNLDTGSTSSSYFWAGNTTAGSNVPASVAIANGDQVSIEIDNLPISQWAGSPNYAGSNDIIYASNSSMGNADASTATTVYGPAGSPFPAVTYTSVRDKSILLPVPMQEGSSVVLQVKYSSISGWIDLQTASIGSAALSHIYTVQNAATYGLGILSATASGVVVVRFGQYAYTSGATYGAAGTDWDGTTGTASYRVVYIPPGTAVGFGEGTLTSLGLVKPSFTANATSQASYSSSTNLVRSGTYTPTAVAMMNLDANPVVGANSMLWTQVGRIVTVSGYVAVNPTTINTASYFTITLPVSITSNFSNFNDAIGTAVFSSSGIGSPGTTGSVTATTGAKTVDIGFYATDTTSGRNFYYQFQYMVN